VQFVTSPFPADIGTSPTHNLLYHHTSRKACRHPIPIAPSHQSPGRQFVRIRRRREHGLLRTCRRPVSHYRIVPRKSFSRPTIYRQKCALSSDGFLSVNCRPGRDFYGAGNILIKRRHQIRDYLSPGGSFMGDIFMLRPACYDATGLSLIRRHVRSHGPSAVRL